MKNLLILGAALAAATAVNAQQFSAKNFGVTGAGSVFEPDGVTKAPAATTLYEVIDQNGTVLVGPKAGFTAGTFSLGTVTDSNVDANGNAKVTVEAWDSTTGATYATASVKAEETVLALTKLAPAPPVGLTAFTTLTLQAAPEPSTYALGALGLGGLLFISRRRK